MNKWSDNFVNQIVVPGGLITSNTHTPICKGCYHISIVLVFFMWMGENDLNMLHVQIFSCPVTHDIHTGYFNIADLSSLQTCVMHEPGK